MTRLCASVLVLAITTGVIKASELGEGAYVLDRRQGNVGLNPTLSFDRIANFTTCESATIRWFYAGPPLSMSLSVTNIGVPQISLPPASPTLTSTSSPATTSPLENRQIHADVVDMEIGSSLNPSSSSFQWPTVNITSGSYRIRATIRTSQSFVQLSDVFHVLRGPNTSCLPSSPSSSSSTPNHHSSSTAPAGSETSTGSSPDTSPVAGASVNRINTATIVGIVLGVLALLLVAIAVYFFLRNRRQKAPGKQSSKKWNALNSTDSRANMMMAMGANVDEDKSHRSRGLSSAHGQRRNYSQSSSIGPTEETVVGGGLSEEKLGEYYSGRKHSVASYDDSQSMALAALPTLPRQNKRSYPDSAMAANVARRRSTDGKGRPQPRYLPTIDSTTNTATVSRTSSLAMASELTHATTASPDPSISPSPTIPHDPKRTNRQSFGRKRKPVPAYDSSTPASPIPPSPMASESHLSHATYLTGSPEMEAGYTVHTHPPPQSNPTGGGHYSRRTAAASRPGTADSADLLHKASFGKDGKPVHYLMPDLPMEVQRQNGGGSGR